VNLVISAKKEDGYLLIEAAGRIFGLDEYKSLTYRIVEEITRYGVRKIVLDGSLITWLQSFRLQGEIVDFYTESLSEEIRLSKIACVVDYDNIGMMKFWEFTANEKGFVVQAFCSRNRAVHWIRCFD
jgi:hypothetical protein